MKLHSFASYRFCFRKPCDVAIEFYLPNSLINIFALEDFIRGAKEHANLLCKGFHHKINLRIHQSRLYLLPTSQFQTYLIAYSTGWENAVSILAARGPFHITWLFTLKKHSRSAQQNGKRGYFGSFPIHASVVNIISFISKCIKPSGIVLILLNTIKNNSNPSPLLSFHVVFSLLRPLESFWSQLMKGSHYNTHPIIQVFIVLTIIRMIFSELESVRVECPSHTQGHKHPTECENNN